ncbi:MAG: gliding motility-associated C-terminal domain-containing protein [Chitinophagaceae bacterium]
MLPSTTGQWNDPAAFDQVCKVGLGDIDISDDGKFLFVTNLYDRKLYRLELDNVFNPQNVINVTSYDLPNITVTNGLLRGFGIGFRKGKLYLGAVSTGELGGSITINGPTDVNAYVFEMNDPLGTATFNPTPVVTIPLNYIKGEAITFNPGSDRWYPWNRTTDSLLDQGEETLPTPVLSDIAFTNTGDIILDFMDRSGHQYAGNSRRHLSGTLMVGSYDVGGDLLIAGFDCNTGNFVVESNGSYTSQGTNVLNGQTGNGQGIGGGEFFNDDWFGGGSLHEETSVGSLAKIPGLNEIIATMMDPVNAFSNGTGRFSTINGTCTGQADLANMTQFGKANSMGDIEASGQYPGLQIGNRVWKDDDGDGIQDPTEVGIDGITLNLYADFNNDDIPDGGSLASFVTANNGLYFFDASNVPDGDPTQSGNQPGPNPYKKYLIALTPADWNGTVGINLIPGYSISPAHIGGAGQPDVRDNDAELKNGFPTVAVFLTSSGKNTHNEDFGFAPCIPLSMQDQTLTCEVTEAQIGTPPEPNTTYAWQPPTGLSNPNIAQPMASPSMTTTYTLTINDACTQTVNVFVDNILPTLNPGPDQEIDCSKNGVKLGTPAIPGYTYKWEPASSLDDPNIAEPTAFPVVTTTYTLTVTGPNKCVSQGVVIVSVSECCTKLVIPNSFSPNDDGKNDYFGIIEIENVTNFNLKVFNRYGEMLFETEDKDYKWDGKYKEKVSDVGTYFYLLTYSCGLTGAKKQLQGDVTLLR